MKTFTMPELLAPAGSIEALRAAVNAGADAVYIGGQHFGARAYADNPSENEILEGIEYCHLRGKKVYLTVNTLLKEMELREQLAEFLAPLYQHGIDAVLVQDLGVLKFIKEHFPGLPLHASTQMSVTSCEGARFLMRHGITRIVPARELSLSEICSIVQTGVEVETFIHGAMCYSYSGRCLFSSMLGGRSGNRGRCAQPCRLPYSVDSAHILPACTGQRGKNTGSSSANYPLSMKDMCALDILPDLIEAGIASFKIEGRMKPPQYSAGVSAIYRKYMDLYAEKGREGYQVEADDRCALLDLFDRGGFSTGYYESASAVSSVSGRGNVSSMVVMKRGERQSAQAAQMKNEKNRGFLKENSKVKINGVLRINPDLPVILRVWTVPSGGSCKPEDSICVEVAGGVPEKARSNAATVEDTARRIKKTGGTDFEFEELSIDLADGIFLPVSMLNELRREALQRLRDEILAQKRRYDDKFRISDDSSVESLAEERSIHVAKRRITILVTLPEQLDAVLTYFSTDEGSLLAQSVDTVYLDSCLLGNPGPLSEACRNLLLKIETFHSYGIRCCFAAPPVLRLSARRIFTEPDVCSLLSQMDGFLVASVDELEFFREQYPSHLFAAEDCLYTFNTEARSLLREEGISRFTLPAELNRKELGDVVFADSELILYGYQPLMQSAQCVRKNTSGCFYSRKGTKRLSGPEEEPEMLYLRDRKNAIFPVLTRCCFCTNTVYNSVPLQLSGYREQIERLGIPYFRLLFTLETKEETIQVLRQYLNDEQKDLKGTRGHFKRGVE